MWNTSDMVTGPRGPAGLLKQGKMCRWEKGPFWTFCVGSKRAGKGKEPLKIAKVLKKKSCKRKQGLYCPNVGSAKTKPWQAGAGTAYYFLPALWRRHPLGPFANPGPCSPACFLHSARSLCRNVALLGHSWGLHGPLSRSRIDSDMGNELHGVYNPPSYPSTLNTKPHAGIANHSSRDACISSVWQKCEFCPFYSSVF